MQRMLVVNDISGQYIDPIFKGQAQAWILKREPIVFLETWVTNYSSILRDIPQKGICHLYRSGSLKSQILDIFIDLSRKISESVVHNPHKYILFSEKISHKL